MQTELDKSLLPKHIAIIMDGNGRWAQGLGMSRVFGHKNGVKAVREVCEQSAELGIEYLTLYAFSTENWQRPRAEVNALMELLVSTIHKEIKTLTKNNIRLTTIGNTEDLPKSTRKALEAAIQDTAHCDGMLLSLALSYSSKWEMTEAVKSIAEKVKKGQLLPEDIDSETISKHLCHPEIPDPELLIRTSGEKRISNFLLWQIAYSELYFTDIMWPDFRRENLIEALRDYQSRNRRFGKTTEQTS